MSQEICLLWQDGNAKAGVLTNDPNGKLYVHDISITATGNRQAIYNDSGTLTIGDEVYYVLETPETIEIDDTNITDPLNAIVTYQYAVGSVTVTTSANVTANLEIKYHSYDINNQYDKYVYIIDTANWEKIG